MNLVLHLRYVDLGPATRRRSLHLSRLFIQRWLPALDQAAERKKPVRNVSRSVFVTGLLLLSGLLSLLGTSVAYAGTTTVEITDVYNALNASDEWFQLYNATDKTIGLNGYQVCTSTTCVAVPTGTIDPFSL